MTKAFQLDYDVLIFTSFVKESFLKAVSVGEMQIYDVINYDKLDGVIVLADTLKDKILNNKIKLFTLILYGKNKKESNINNF